MTSYKNLNNLPKLFTIKHYEVSHIAKKNI